MITRVKNFFSTAHLITLLLVAFCVALFAYLLLSTYRHRFDLSPERVYSLSSQTKQVLDALKEDSIQITAFFREDHPKRQAALHLLKEYKYHHPKLEYQFYDPDRMPAKVKQFKIDAYETLVIEAKGKREQTKLISEEAFTNLLSRLYRDQTKTIYFATGHGEASLDDIKSQSGYGSFKEKLTDVRYQVKRVTLARQSVPEDADLLVVSGPKVDLLPEELEVIGHYLNEGGRALVLIDPVDLSEGAHLEAFLEEYGILLGKDVIVDKQSKLYGADYLIPFITEYKPHPITKGFEISSFFPVTRTVRRAENATPELQITELAWTGTGSWAERDLDQLEEGQAQYDETQDLLGPLPVAVSVEHPEANWRLVVFGDSEFVANSYINLSGNKDFILNTVAWLLGDTFQVSIRPRLRTATPLYLKEVDQQFLFIVPVLGLPLLCLCLGACVWVWRRRYT